MSCVLTIMASPPLAGLRPLAGCCVSAALLAMALPALARQASPPEWPEVTREARPWTRWWWQGSAVDEVNLTRELEAMERAGLT